MQLDLLAQTPPELAAWVETLGEKPYRANQIFQALHQRGQLRVEELSTLSLDFRQRLSAMADMNVVRISGVKEGRDGTRKYQMLTVDGQMVESVFIPNASADGRNTLCISSQVGCAMGCTFCATAAIKLKRNLKASEIVSQVYVVNNDLAKLGVKVEDKRVIHNIVYMGMGEPLHNYDNVVQSIHLLTNANGQGYSPRRITVSTSGIVKNIVKLGTDTDVNIAISLNATTNDVRTQIMPVNQRWNIEELLAACRDFPLDARRRITFEYVLLAGINDSDEDAQRLIHLVRKMDCRVNLIPFNEHPLAPFKRPSHNTVMHFQWLLQNKGITVFVRSTRGDDVDAACGMLGAQKLEEARHIN